MRRFACIQVPILLLIPTLVWGASLALSLEQVSRRADTIVVGTVKEVGDGYRAHWPGVGKVVYHDVTIEVQETWKGAARKQITLQVLGGTLPEEGKRVEASCAPRFRDDQKVLVFAKMSRERLRVFGGEQGCYEVIRERVVGREKFPVAKDILTSALRRKIRDILAQVEAEEAGSPDAGDSREAGR